MSAAAGVYFDGTRSLRHPVEVTLEGRSLGLTGDAVQLRFDARAVRVSQRIARTPRWLYLPDGGTCMLHDGAFLDRLERPRGFARVLHRLESQPAYAVIAVALVVGALWLMLDRGVPAAVEQVVKHIPLETEEALGSETLATLDRYLLRPTRLAPARQTALLPQFDAMVAAVDAGADYRIVFRSSPRVGPNAFALPSGIIVMTDELVGLAESDGEILGVLAHELGHVRHRHAMRSLLEGSVTALVIAGVTGDIAATTSLAVAAPAVILQNKYSRDSEREADRYAIDLMRDAGVDPRGFAALLARMEKNAPANGIVPPFLSSHPPTAEREALVGEAPRTQQTR